MARQTSALRLIYFGGGLLVGYLLGQLALARRQLCSIPRALPLLAPAGVRDIVYRLRAA